MGHVDRGSLNSTKRSPSGNRYATGIAVLMAGHARAAAVLIMDDFSSGTISNGNRIRTNQANGNWYKRDNSSEWTIGSNVISSIGTAGAVVTEGALSQVVATDSLANDLTKLTLSFDYTVGATLTLKFALIGYTANLQTGQGAGNILMNNGTANGGLQSSTQAELRNGDINLLTGADMTQSITNDLTFAAGTSGSYSNTFDLTAYAWHADEAAPANTPGLSGSIASHADFDYVVLVAVNDLSTTTGSSTTFLDNVSLTATAVPEPSSFALLGGALACFTMRRRRRRA